MNHNESDPDQSVSHGTKDILKEFVFTEMILNALIALFGIAGNFLTMRVLRCPHLRQTSTGLYLTCLSAVDIVVLIVGPTAKSLSAAVFVSDRHVRDVHELACKLMLFVNYSASQISAWVLVAVTVDRAVWVLQPFRARQLCTVRRAAVAATAIALAVCCVNLQVLLHARLMPRTSENSTVCHIHDPLTRHAYVTYVDPALVTVGPFLVMLVANLLIVKRLRRLRMRREASLHKRRRPPAVRRSGGSGRSGGCTGGGGSGGWGSNLTKMLLCTNAFYLISSLPYLLLMLLLKEKRTEILRDPIVLNIVYLAQVLSYSLFNLNYAMHFLLYCLVGPTFKVEAFRLLGIRPKQQQQQQRQNHQLQIEQPQGQQPQPDYQELDEQPQLDNQEHDEQPQQTIDHQEQKHQPQLDHQGQDQQLLLENHEQSQQFQQNTEITMLDQQSQLDYQEQDQELPLRTDRLGDQQSDEVADPTPEEKQLLVTVVHSTTM